MNWNQLRFYIIRLKKAPVAEWPRRVRERFFISLLKAAPALFSHSVKAPKADPKLWETLRFPSLEGAAEASVRAGFWTARSFAWGQENQGSPGSRMPGPDVFFQKSGLTPKVRTSGRPGNRPGSSTLPLCFIKSRKTRTRLTRIR